MRARFDEQLCQLNDMLIDMGSLCENAIRCAIKAFEEDSAEMRNETYEIDKVIDDREREIESVCMKLLMQQQPVARDLRQISSAMKMISDMERIGDQASDIAEISATMKFINKKKGQEHIGQMAQAVINMLTQSISSFVNKDIELAEKAIAMDDIVDELFEIVKEDLLDVVAEDRKSGEYFLDILMIAKYLERIGDHAENIAEWVIYSVTGRHADELRLDMKL